MTEGLPLLERILRIFAVASPRANGQVERLNRTILNSHTAYMGDEQKGWGACLPKVQLGIISIKIIV